MNMPSYIRSPSYQQSAKELIKQGHLYTCPQCLQEAESYDDEDPMHTNVASVTDLEKRQKKVSIGFF